MIFFGGVGGDEQKAISSKSRSLPKIYRINKDQRMRKFDLRTGGIGGAAIEINTPSLPADCLAKSTPVVNPRTPDQIQAKHREGRKIRTSPKDPSSIEKGKGRKGATAVGRERFFLSIG